MGKIQPRFNVPAEAKVSFIRKISKNPQNFKDLPHFGQFPAEAREAKQAVLYAPAPYEVKMGHLLLKFEKSFWNLK